MNQIISKIYPKTKNSKYAVDSVYLRKRLIFKKILTNQCITQIS